MKSNLENFHLYIVRNVESDFNSRLSSDSDILVYIQRPADNLPIYETIIAAPGFVDFEVFKFLPPKPPTFPNLQEPEKPQIMVTIASNMDDDFMTNYASSPHGLMKLMMTLKSWVNSRKPLSPIIIRKL